MNGVTRKLIAALLSFTVVVLVWQHFAPIPHEAGVLIRDEPEQTLITTPLPVIQIKGWTLKPLAIYNIQARVLGITHYTGDASDDLSPYDVAVGWGSMSDTAVLERLDISQSNRFFHWRYWGQKPPIPEREIMRHSANMHLIPEGTGVLNRIAALRKGSLVKLTGYLVQATHPQASKPWRSSLSRDDDGEGACELMLVRTVTTVPNPASTPDTSPTAPPR